MKKNTHSSMIKKVIPAVLTALTVAVSGISVLAGAFDEYYDYQNPDGTYSYYFSQGVTVTMDEDWYQHTLVVPGDQGATFYHKASYEKYKEQGYEGGRLFTLAASVNTDFRKLPRFEFIGFDEEECMNYFAVLPTDLQAWMEDSSITEEYERIYQGVNDVIAGIRLEKGSSEGSDEESAEGSADALPAFYAEKIETDANAVSYLAEIIDGFREKYDGRIVSGPEAVTCRPAETDRKLAGFRGVYRSPDGVREYTVLEYVEYSGDELYHYYCSYMSGTDAEDEHEDETTYFEFMDMIDAMTEPG